MGLNEILLVCAALIPAIVLAVYIFIKDRAEKEPIKLLLVLLVCGVISCFPAMFIEDALISAINSVFGVATDLPVFSDNLTNILYQFSFNFIGIALVEEGLKWLFLFFITRKNKNFNSLFDGIIYAVFVSLGFAAFENILYVLEYGWGTAISRAILSVPGHMFFAVVMGYYYSLWNVYEKAKRQEAVFDNNGMIHITSKRFSGKKHLLLSLLVPVSIHGFYDFCCSFSSFGSTIILIVFVIFLYIYCFRKIRDISKKDTADVAVSFSLVCKKYPGLLGKITEANSQNVN
ncbi:MAG: PrsW family intramembrane metalloprotease [Clostridia bacterium]|nr:PrsW family intramembrane metalloprotease [Clostridia bacterium]